MIKTFNSFNFSLSDLEIFLRNKGLMLEGNPLCDIQLNTDKSITVFQKNEPLTEEQNLFLKSKIRDLVYGEKNISLKRFIKNLPSDIITFGDIYRLRAEIQNLKEVSTKTGLFEMEKIFKKLKLALEISYIRD